MLGKSLAHITCDYICIALYICVRLSLGTCTSGDCCVHWLWLQGITLRQSIAPKVVCMCTTGPVVACAGMTHCCNLAVLAQPSNGTHAELIPHLSVVVVGQQALLGPVSFQ